MSNSEDQDLNNQGPKGSGSSRSGSGKANNNKGGQPAQPAAGDFPIQEYRLVPVDEIHEYGGHEEDEIDLIELAKTIWDARTTIYKFVGVGLVLGLFVAFAMGEEYETETTLMPEYNNASQSGAAGLLSKYGGLLGISGSGSYASSSNAIRVQLYPNIAESLPFQMALLNKQIYFSEYDTTISVFKYFTEVKEPALLSSVTKYTIKLPFTILGWMSSVDEASEADCLAVRNGIEASEIVSISKQQNSIINMMKERVTVSLEEQTGIVSVTAKMPEAEASAVVAEVAVDQLFEYLTDYRTEKLKTDLVFLEEQIKDAKKRYEQAQIALTNFQEQNVGGMSAAAQAEMQALQLEFDISSSIYQNFTQQIEQTRLKIQEEIPLFKVLEPVKVPLSISEPNRKLIIVVVILLFGIVSLGWIFGKEFLKNLNWQ